MQMKYPVYAPCPLNNMQAICEFFGVSDRIVKRWMSEGAPICKRGDGTSTTYRSEGVALSFWVTNSTSDFSKESEV